MRFLVSAVAFAFLLAPGALAFADQNVPRTEPDITPRATVEAVPKQPIKYEANNPRALKGITGLPGFAGQCPKGWGHSDLDGKCIPCARPKHPGDPVGLGCPM